MSKLETSVHRTRGLSSPSCCAEKDKGKQVIQKLRSSQRRYSTVQHSIAQHCSTSAGERGDLASGGAGQGINTKGFQNVILTCSEANYLLNGTGKLRIYCQTEPGSRILCFMYAQKTQKEAFGSSFCLQTGRVT